MALKSLLVEQLVVRMVKPGILVIDSHVGADGNPIAWRQIDTGVWQSAADPLQRLYTRKNAAGEWELSGSGGPPNIRHRSPWYRHQLFMRAVLLSSLVVLLVGVLGQLLSPLFRGGSNAGGSPAPRAAHVRRIVGISGFLVLAPWIVCGSIALVVEHDLLFVSSQACGMLLRAAQILAWAGAAATAAILWITVVRRSTPGASWARRGYHALVCLACLGATAMAWQGGLLFWDGRF